jgi:tetratricopeptide (TPR) repeat protein
MSFTRCLFRIRSGLAALLLSLTCIEMAGAQTLPPGCGSLQREWGPFDYRPERYIPESTYRSHNALLNVVEHAHFTPEVEALIRGKSSGALPGGDLSYTLSVFPNHHRALLAISKLAVREKSPQPKQTLYSVECYFQRAIAFRPDDNMVRMIYANHLIQIGRVPDAVAQIDTVASRNPDSAFTQRSISLLYFDSNSYEKALTHAHKASELGLNIDGVKAQLQKVGKWQDAPTQNPANPANAASTPASASSRKE